MDEASITSTTINTDDGCQALARLPPCKVCGDKASGYHYGVNSCQGCKSFFKRALLRPVVRPCKFVGKCKLTSEGKKHVCASCRYKRCVELGMSKDSTKSGRYTLEKQTHDIQEIRQLEVQARVTHGGESLLDKQQREGEMDKIVENLMKAEQPKGIYMGNPADGSCSKQEQFINDRSIREQIFGTMKPLSPKEYDKIYTATGLDVDGRRDVLIRSLFHVRNVETFRINFLKVLPGFNNLRVEDKLALAKNSYSIFYTLMFYQYFNTKELLWDNVDWGIFFTTEMTNGYVKLVDRLRQLELTPPEQYVLTGFGLLTSDADLSTEGEQIVESSQHVLIDTLRMLLSRSHGNSDAAFYRCHDVMVDVKTTAQSLEEERNRIMETFQVQWPDPDF